MTLSIVYLSTALNFPVSPHSCQYPDSAKSTLLTIPSLSGTSSLSSESPIDYPSLYVVDCHCSLGQPGFHPKVASHVIIFPTACCLFSQYIHASLLSHSPVPISCLTALLSLVSPLRHQVQPCLMAVNLKGSSLTRGDSGEEAERLKSEV